MLKLIAAALILAATPAIAELPDAPTPAPTNLTSSSSLHPIIASSSITLQKKSVRLTKYDYALYGGIIAYRTGDYLTTMKNQRMGGHEVELPKIFTASKPGFATYSAGFAALEIGGSYWMHRRGHAKLARVLDSLSVAGGGATVLSNYMHFRQSVINDRLNKLQSEQPLTNCTVANPCSAHN